jgi:hypothetical protein
MRYFPNRLSWMSCGSHAECCMLHQVEVNISLAQFQPYREIMPNMMENRPEYQAFRARLDAILREKAPARLRDFLVAEGQWPEDVATDVEAAQWMMIATSPALADQHEEAERWLLSHGHETEARAIFGERKSNKTSSHRQHGRQKRS